LLFFQLLIILNIQEARINIVNEDKNVQICSIFICAGKSKLFKKGCVVIVRFV